MPLSKALTPQKTFIATIYVGFKEGYDGAVHTLDEVHAVLQRYCNVKGFCVTVTPTHFVYSQGNEPGVAVGLIQYPRFPWAEAELEKSAIEIATELMLKLNQNRVSIVFPAQTVTLERLREAA